MCEKNKDIITLTPKAIAHIKTIMAQQRGTAFRLSIKKSGCSGYRYQPEVINDNSQSNRDDIIRIIDNLIVFIDKQCVDIIRGTRLDIQNKMLGQQVLMFNNPNVEETCGCGESFNLK